MKIGVGHFNKMASDYYKNLSQSDRDRLASHSSKSSNDAASDTVKSATKIFKIIHNKVHMMPIICGNINVCWLYYRFRN